MKRIAVMLLLFTAAPVLAQESVTFSIGGGAGLGIPTGDLSDADADVAFGFEIEVGAAFTPMFGAYARYMYYSFGVDSGDPAVDASLVDKGFGLGAHVSFTDDGDASLSPWVEAGLIYNTVTAEASSGGISGSAESDPGLGFEVGAGLDIPLGDAGLMVRPRAYYRSYSPEDGTTISYGVLGVGLSYAFMQ